MITLHASTFPPRMGLLSVARGGSLGCKPYPKVWGPAWRAVCSKIHQISNLLDSYLFRSWCIILRVFCVSEDDGNAKMPRIWDRHPFAITAKHSLPNSGAFYHIVFITLPMRLKLEASQS